MKTDPLFRGCLTAALLLAGTLGSTAQTLNVTNDLQLWLRADAGVTTNASGGVIQWNDQTPNGNNALQTVDAEAPILVNAVLNSKPTVRFDGVDDYLNVTDSPSLSGTGDMSTFFVVKFDDFATYRAVWGKTAGTAGNLPAPMDIYALPGSGVLRAFRGDGTLVNLSSGDTAQALRENAYLVLGIDVAGETLTHYLNNQPNGSAIVTTNTLDGNTDLKIGTRQDLFTKLKGDMAELLIYSRSLSSTERSNVFSYLQNKYNLLNLLPNVSLSANAGPNVSVGQEVTLTAAANDLDGTISKVEFLANGTLIGTASVPPYSIRTIIESGGSVAFTARATDNKAGFTVSSALTLTAGPNGPQDLPVTDGLQLWLKADAGTTLGLAGGVVSWEDQSGHGNHAVQLNEAAAPTFTNSAVNGRPALRFDGVDDFLEIADSDSISITGDITSFFVLRFTDFATFRGVWGKTAGAAGNLPAPTDMYALPNNGRLRLFRGSGLSTGNQSVDAAQPFAAGVFLLGGFEVGGTSVRHYYNGLLNGTGSFTVPAGDGNGTLRVGTRADGVTRMKGEMSEILIFNRTLSATERRSVERYLAEKYQLTTLLSVTNTPPAVAITAPVGEILQAPGTVAVTASASDNDGSIASVQFVANGVSLGTDTSAPFGTNLNLTYGGRVTLRAVATDNLGRQSQSASVEVCVQGPGVPNGLVGYWPLDGNANALIGTGGIMVSNPVPTIDRNGNTAGALSFNGLLQQRVEIPGGGGLNGAARGSISMWVNWSGIQDTGFGGAAGAVLSRQQDGSFSDNILNLSSADPNSAVLQWRQTAAGTVNAGGTVPVGDNIWRHIVVTFTTTNSQVYLDGFPEASGTGGALHANAATPLAIGAWAGGGGSFATASIDDVAIWNRVLTVEEVQLLAGQLRTPLDLQVVPDCITIERSAENVLVKWGSSSILQGASEVAGPYQDLEVTSPFSIPVAEAPKYFRLRSP